MSRTTLISSVSAALAATTLLGLTACSDPGASAAAGANPAATAVSAGVKQFNLSPQQDRVKVTASAEAAALVPEAIKQDGKLTVAVSPFAAPLAVYATDNKTPVGNEVDIAVALAQSLGLEAEIVPTARTRPPGWPWRPAART
ncbi:ABC-type amino acid transport substrate-binding protein [Arthrobacter sp. UYEF20]